MLKSERPGKLLLTLVQLTTNSVTGYDEQSRFNVQKVRIQ